MDFLWALDAEADIKFHSCLIWAQDADECSACQVSNWGTAQSGSKSVAYVIASCGWKIVMNNKKAVSWNERVVDYLKVLYRH